VIGLPPFDGAVHVTVAWELPGVADTAVGAPGTVGAGTGVTAADAADAGPLPMPFVAVTVNVYDVPSVRPVTIADVLALLAVKFPGVDVTV
jgi:hypothetical protein